MLTKSLRYFFRFRKEFETAIGSPIKSLEQLSRKFHEVERLISTPQDITLFQQNILKVRPRFKKLADFSNIQTSLLNSYTNSMIFEISNSAIESEMPQITKRKDIQMIAKISGPLLQQAEQYRLLMRNFKLTKHLTDAVRRRFSIIEEMLSDLLFEGYSQFKKDSVEKNIFETNLKKTNYKEDFQFKIGAIPVDQVDLLADVFLAFGMCNTGNQKLYLMIEIIFRSYYNKMSKSSFGKYAYCLSKSKRAVKSIEQEICELISQSDTKEPDPWFVVGSLSYLLVNKILIFSSFEALSNGIKNQKFLSKLSQWQQNQLYSLNLGLKCEQTLSLLELKLPKEWSLRVAKNMRSLESQIGGQEQEFDAYIKKHKYFHTINEDNFLMKRLYSLASEKFIFMDMGLIIFKNKDIGMMNLLKGYYKQNKTNIKIVSAHNIITKEKKTQVDRYFSSKVRGCKKQFTSRELKFIF